MKGKILLLILVAFSSCKKKGEYVYPEKKEIIQSIYSSVIIEPEDSYQAYCPVTGVIESVLRKEGDIVKKGDVILKIKNINAELQTQKAYLNVEQAKENLTSQFDLIKDLEYELNIAIQKHKTDSLMFFRQKALLEKNIGSKNEYETKKLAYDVAKSNLKLIQNKYLRTKSQLETQLQQSKIIYQENVNNKSDYTLKSIIDGVIYELDKSPGEISTPQTALFQIGSKDSFNIVFEIDEVDIKHIDIGMKAVVVLDAYGDEVFEATVSRIYPKINSRTQTFKIEGKFIKQPKKLYPGLTGEANILFSEKRIAYTIPSNYLKNNTVITENGPVEVEIGQKSLNFTEIISGISDSTKIYKPEDEL